MATLTVESREGTGKYASFEMRKQGFIPGVVYGKGLKENLNIRIPIKEFAHLLHTGQRIVDLTVGKKKHKTIVKDVQHGTFDHEILHADFRIVSETDVVHVSVEVELTGEAEGQKTGGVIEQSTFQVDIECLPKDLPSRIALDISDLAVDQVVYVRDLPVIEGVTYRTSKDVSVVSCHMPAGEEAAEEAAEEEGETAQPEVIGEKKEESESQE